MNTQPPQPSQAFAPIILPEILGFSPHLALDDIIDIVNDAIRQTVDAMEEFILRWAAERSQSCTADWDAKAESEMGIISLQTLLESHADVAFDAFEAWSLRNIFTFAPELPIVVPHHSGLNLRYPDGSELAAMNEIEQLRKKIDIQRHLKRHFRSAVRKSAMQREASEARLANLLPLNALQSFTASRVNFEQYYHTIASLPPFDSELSQLVLQDAGRRQWELSRAGYLNWAVGQLMNKTKVREGGMDTSSRRDQMLLSNPDTVKAALQAVQGSRRISP